MLFSSFGLLAVAAGTAVAVAAPQAASSRMEVVKRAQQKGSLLRRQGPSAVPVPRCGSMPVGQTFALRGYSASSNTYSYITVQDQGLDGGYLISSDSSMVPFYFNIECNLVREGTGHELFFLSNTDISVVQVGEDYFAEQQGVTQFANCAITDGLLTCGSASIPTGQFCNAGSAYVYFAATGSIGGCSGGPIEYRPFVAPP